MTTAQQCVNNSDNYPDEDAEFLRAVSELQDFIVAASTKSEEIIITTAGTQTGVGDDEGDDNGKLCVATPCVCKKCKEKRRRRKERKEILRCVVSEKEDETKRLKCELATERKTNVTLLKDLKSIQKRLFVLNTEIKSLERHIEEIDSACELERKRFKSDKMTFVNTIKDLQETVQKKDERIAFLEMSLGEAISNLTSATNFVQVLKGVDI